MAPADGEDRDAPSGAGPDEVTDGSPVTTEEPSGADGDERSLGTSASRGFLWANVGILTKYVTALVLAATLARILDTQDYAVMVTLMLVTFYFDNALDLGMGAALVYEQEEGVSERVQVAWTANLGLGVVLAGVAWLVAPLIAAFFQQDDFVTVFRCLAVVIVISALNTVPWSLFMRNMQFGRRAGVEVARDLSRFGVTISLALAGYGAWSVLWGLIASNTVQLVGTWAVLRFRPRFRWDGGIVRELFAYAWRVAGNRVLGILALNGDYFVVGNRRNDQYAFYYQAFRLPEFIMGAQLNALSAVLFPMYSRIRSDGNDALRQAMYKALGLVSLFSFPVGVGLALIARDAFTVFYGDQNQVAIQTMELLSLAGAVAGLGFATGDLLMAINRPGLLLRINAVMVPTMLVVMWFVAPEGIVWVAAVHLGIQLVFISVRQVAVDRLIGASAVRVLASIGPGLAVAAGVTLFALPVRLATPTGFTSLVAITAAGLVGGLLTTAALPPARETALDLVRKLRGG